MAKQNSTRVAAQTIKQEPFNAETTVEGKQAKAPEPSAPSFDPPVNKAKTIKTMKEFLGSAIHVTNYPMQIFRALSQEPSDWAVSHFFPAVMRKVKKADGQGEELRAVPVYVDHPVTPRQKAVCLKKAALMAEKGLDYYILEQEQMMTGEQIKALELAKGNPASSSSDSFERPGHVEVL
jgi:hypothetical protein